MICQNRIEVADTAACTATGPTPPLMSPQQVYLLCSLQGVPRSRSVDDLGHSLQDSICMPQEEATVPRQEEVAVGALEPSTFIHKEAGLPGLRVVATCIVRTAMAPAMNTHGERHVLQSVQSVCCWVLLLCSDCH